MKSIVVIPMIAVSCAVFLLATQTPKEILRKEGAAPGHTGSPGDSLKNCTVCHGGDALPRTGWITSDIPASGYEPGRTYTIAATNTESSATRLGFQVSPQDEKGNLLGTLLRTDTVETQLVGNNKYITYTENGITGNGKRTWKFGWKAPEKGTGTVTFYGAFNSNADNHKENDKTFLSTLTVQETGTVSLVTEEPADNTLLVYPNPANNILTVRSSHSLSGVIELIDMNGRTVLTSQSPVIQVEGIAPGSYTLRCGASNTRVVIDR